MNPGPRVAFGEQTCTACGQTNYVAGLYDGTRIPEASNNEVYCGWCGMRFKAVIDRTPLKEPDEPTPLPPSPGDGPRPDGSDAAGTSAAVDPNPGVGSGPVL